MYLGTGKRSQPGHESRIIKDITSIPLCNSEKSETTQMPIYRGVARITDSKDMNLSKLQEIVKDREAWRAAAHGIAKSHT